ncbi:hypothetical protein [Poseidonibacter lekithochrous]|uniref:hypothetical protein n=1 Tax=Poseidonibacter lekithochrous TaxID=1904463 RepID=UPI000D37C76E|nr:hypothetical protein [Poseidonibacter lekithochrous]
MKELYFSYSAPHYDKVYFNFEEEISILLSALNTSKNKIYNIYPKDYYIAQKIATHSFKILPKIKNADIYTFWFHFNQNNYISFAEQLKEFLIKIWRNNSFNYSNKEESILSILVKEKNIKEFAKINFGALFSKLYDKQFIVVIDIVSNEIDSSEVNKLEEVFSLIKNIQELKETLNVNTVVLNNDYLYNAENIKLDIDNETIKPYLKMLEQVNTYKSVDSKNYINNNLNKLVHIINPIVMLNQTVSNEVINYISNSNNEIEKEISNLINSNVIEENFYNTGYNLTREYFNNFKKNNVNALDIITSNGSKILSFQSPYKLLNDDFSLKTLKDAHRENFMIIDIVSALLSSKINNNKMESNLYDISLSLSNEVVDILNISNEYYTKILLSYFSQLFLKDYKLDYKYFKLLENLTYGLSNFTENIYKNDNNKKYNISRWITNLGYIYDEMKYTKGDRERIYYNASQRVSKIDNFTNETIELKTKYTLGWQLLDANRIKESIDVFYQIAKKYFYKFKNDEFNKPYYLVYELYWIGYILSQTHNIESKFFDVKIMDSILFENPIFYSVLDINKFLEKKYKHIKFYNNHTYTLFFCNYDLYTAIVVSYQLILKKCNIELVLVEKKKDIKLRKNNIILGAPDSPNGIGDYIKDKDKDLTSLYQIRLFDNFNEVSKNKDFTVLMGCGVGSMFNGLNKLLETIKEGEKDMDLGLLLPFIQQAGTNLWEVTLDTMGEVIKKKLENTIIQNNTIDNEISNLKNIDNEEREQSFKLLLETDNKIIKQAFTEVISDSTIILKIIKKVSQTELRTFEEIENLNKVGLYLIDIIKNSDKVTLEDHDYISDIRKDMLNIQTSLNKIKRNRHNINFEKLNEINIEQSDIIHNFLDYIL